MRLQPRQRCLSWKIKLKFLSTKNFHIQMISIWKYYKNGRSFLPTKKQMHYFNFFIYVCLRKKKSNDPAPIWTTRNASVVNRIFSAFVFCINGAGWGTEAKKLILLNPQKSVVAERIDEKTSWEWKNTYNWFFFS